MTNGDDDDKAALAAIARRAKRMAYAEEFYPDEAYAFTVEDINNRYKEAQETDAFKEWSEKYDSAPASRLSNQLPDRIDTIVEMDHAADEDLRKAEEEYETALEAHKKEKEKFEKQWDKDGIKIDKAHTDAAIAFDNARTKIGTELNKLKARVSVKEFSNLLLGVVARAKEKHEGGSSVSSLRLYMQIARGEKTWDQHREENKAANIKKRAEAKAATETTDGDADDDAGETNGDDTDTDTTAARTSANGSEKTTEVFTLGEAKARLAADLGRLDPKDRDRLLKYCTEQVVKLNARAVTSKQGK